MLRSCNLADTFSCGTTETIQTILWCSVHSTYYRDIALCSQSRLGHIASIRRFAKLIRGSWFATVVVMSERSTEQIGELLDSVYRVDSGRILATLIRLLGDFDLAEEAMHEAFVAALSLWPRSGVPDNPRPWMISTASLDPLKIIHPNCNYLRMQLYICICRYRPAINCFAG